jgi:hypothetical protein
MIGRVLNIINPITETLRPANSALITPLNPANGLPTILPNQSPPHIYSNLAPFTFGSASTVVSYSRLRSAYLRHCHASDESAVRHGDQWLAGPRAGICKPA